MKPQNFEEKLVWYYMLGTYGWYFLGALYILGPARWFLTIYLKKCNQTKYIVQTNEAYLIWIWLVCMLIMELALIMGHKTLT